jgi:hypothetical protein
VQALPAALLRWRQAHDMTGPAFAGPFHFVEVKME